MTDTIHDQVREKDHAVLRCIRDGHDTTRAIRDATTLSNREVHYSLDKLQELELIETETPDGRVTEVIDGRERTFDAPRQAALTDQGVTYVTHTGQEHTRYHERSHRELVERVYELEEEVEALRSSLETFRQQVSDRLD